MPTGTISGWDWLWPALAVMVGPFLWGFFGAAARDVWKWWRSR